MAITSVYLAVAQDIRKPDNHLLSRTLRARDNGAADGIRCLRGAKRRTTTRIKPTSDVKAYGFSALAAYPPLRQHTNTPRRPPGVDFAIFSSYTKCVRIDFDPAKDKLNLASHGLSLAFARKACLG